MPYQIHLPQSIKIIKKEGNLSEIQIEGCHPGYGFTVANSLRRVLLSSLPGTAIVGFKIKGIDHEFSTLPYVLEDIVTVGLNLKKVRFSSRELLFGKTAQATLKTKGAKKIKAGDIKTPAGIDVINPDLHIATIDDKKGEIDMEIFISSGYGYEQSEHRHKEKLPIGMIALDAVYSPILKVGYKIEDMRIGEKTDFNKVVMSLETDGSIDAEEAIKQAASILQDYFASLLKIKKEPATKTAKKAKTTKETKDRKSSKAGISKQKTDKPALKELQDLGLQDRIIDLLQQGGIKSIAGLIRKKEQDIINIKGLGDKALKEIKAKLKKFKLSLKEK